VKPRKSNPVIEKCRSHRKILLFTSPVQRDISAGISLYLFKLRYFLCTSSLPMVVGLAFIEINEYVRTQAQQTTATTVSTSWELFRDSTTTTNNSDHRKTSQNVAESRHRTISNEVDTSQCFKSHFNGEPRLRPGCITRHYRHRCKKTLKKKKHIKTFKNSRNLVHMCRYKLPATGQNSAQNGLS